MGEQSTQGTTRRDTRPLAELSARLTGVLPHPGLPPHPDDDRLRTSPHVDHP